MKTIVIAAIAVVLMLSRHVQAHRLDEYLQATMITVARDHLDIQLRLTPGVEVFPKVSAEIDTDHDGNISGAEQQSYIGRVRRDLSLTVDGRDVPMLLVSSTFPAMNEMKEGLGDILLNFRADVPEINGTRTARLENHHHPEMSVYLANCFVPRDPAIHITGQDRNYSQSTYTLTYSQSAGTLAGDQNQASGNQSGNQSLFKAYLYQGIHHILTGYDHLLFVSALVLAATTLWDLVKVVSTFTLAHTITLTLAALNIVHLSGRIVEPLISASIVFVALQNVFWPRRARGWSRLGAAFFFGLFHGLGFAGGLLEAMRDMQSSTMLLAILAFSIGVELGHQMIVLPLFFTLKAARQTRPDVVTRAQLSMAVQRFGSAGISLAGFYYLCLAFIGNA